MSTRGWFVGLLSCFAAAMVAAAPAPARESPPRPPATATTKASLTQAWLNRLEIVKASALGRAGNDATLVAKINTQYAKVKVQIEAGHFPMPYVGNPPANGAETWFLQQRLSGSKTPLAAGAVEQAFQNALANNTFKGPKGHSPSAIPSWTPLGPAPSTEGDVDDGSGPFLPSAPSPSNSLQLLLGSVSGRVTAIAVDPADPSGNTVYIGTANGGVWRTTNANALDPIFGVLSVANWTPLTDSQNASAIGSLAIDPTNSNIIYAGTGEGGQACDSYDGHGILKSTNAGQTWTRLNPNFFLTGVAHVNPYAPFDDRSVDKILVSSDGATIFAATIAGRNSSGTGSCGFGGLFNNSQAPAGAVFRSTDGGVNWREMNVPTGATGPWSITDMALDPTTNNTLYVAVAEGYQIVAGPPPDLANIGIWKSTNAATALNPSFTEKNSGFPDLTDLGFSGAPSQNIKLTIGGNSSARQILYVSIANQDGFYNTQFDGQGGSGNGSQDLVGLFRSADGASTWQHVDNSQDSTCDVDSSGVFTNCTPTGFDEGWQGHAVMVSGGSASISPPIPGRLELFDTTYGRIADTNGYPGVASTGVTVSVGSYPIFCDGVCYKAMELALDPKDTGAYTLYLGGTEQFFENFEGDENIGFHSHWRSDDGGGTWTGISQNGLIDPDTGAPSGLHEGAHSFAFNTATTPSEVFAGTDGGIWSSANSGDYWNNLNTNLSITSFQSVSTHPFNPEILLGGAQDTGTHLLDQAGTGMSLLFPPIAPAWFNTDHGWFATSGDFGQGDPFFPYFDFRATEDGGQTLIDPLNPETMYHTYFNASNQLIGPTMTTDGGVTGVFDWDFVGGYYGYFFNPYGDGNGINMDDPVSYYMPMALNAAAGQYNGGGTPQPNGPSVVYIGTDSLYRSANPGPAYDGPYWSQETYDIATYPYLGQGVLTSIASVPALDGSNNETVFTGSSGGVIARVKDMNGTTCVTCGPQVTSDLIDQESAANGYATPPRFITQVLVDPTDPTGNTVWVTYSGFQSQDLPNWIGNDLGHVFMSTDAVTDTPATWTDMSGDLPDIPINGIALDPTTVVPLGSPIIYLASDLGVFESLDGGVHYALINNGMPAVPIYSIERNANTGQVIAGSHGRGAFQLVANGGPDSTPPFCGGFYDDEGTGSGLNLEYQGTATDSAPGDSGVASVTLLGGASSPLVISNLTYSDLGHASYVVTAALPCAGGSDYVVVTDHAGNQTSCQVTIDPNPAVGADLSVGVADNTSPSGTATVGDNLIYTVTVTNNAGVDSASAASNVNLIINLPTAGLVSATWVNADGSPTSGSCLPNNPTPGQITCSMGDLNNGDSATATITVDPNVTIGNSTTATFVVTSDTCDPSSGNNTVMDTTTIAASSLTPTALAIDDAAADNGGDVNDNGNGVIEAGETFIVTPTWQNTGLANNTFTGSSDPNNPNDFTGPIDLLVDLYQINDGSASYGPLGAGSSGDCGGDCYQLTVNTPTGGVRPAIHWDSFFTEHLSDGTAKTWTLHIGNSFSDVPESDQYYYFIETMFHNNITLGCSSTPDSNGQGMFCGSSTLDRESMAAFIARDLAGGDFNVPFSQGSGPHPYNCNSGPSNFADVPVGNPFCRHINYIYNYSPSVTSGCGGGDFCPLAPLTREEMAPFIARLEAGSDAAVDETEPTGPHPYDCTSSSPSDWPFPDVPNTNIYCRFIGYLHNTEVVNGYPDGNYGPTDTLTREQSSVFMVRGLSMKLYKP